MYKLTVTELADTDLDDIIAYIIVTLSNRTAAGSFLDSVEECYSALKHSPYMYEECRDERLRELGYRRAVIKNYIMVYKVDEAQKTIYILRFFYGAREYEKLL